MFSQTPFEDILRLMWFCGLIFQPRQPVCSLSVRELHFSQFVDEMSTSSPPGSPTKWLEALCVQRFSQTHESTLFECFVSLYFYLTKPLINVFSGNCSENTFIMRKLLCNLRFTGRAAVGRRLLEAFVDSTSSGFARMELFFSLARIKSRILEWIF